MQFKRIFAATLGVFALAPLVGYNSQLGDEAIELVQSFEAVLADSTFQDRLKQKDADALAYIRGLTRSARKVEARGLGKAKLRLYLKSMRLNAEIAELWAQGLYEDGFQETSRQTLLRDFKTLEEQIGNADGPVKSAPISDYTVPGASWSANPESKVTIKNWFLDSVVGQRVGVRSEPGAETLYFNCPTRLLTSSGLTKMDKGTRVCIGVRSDGSDAFGVFGFDFDESRRFTNRNCEILPPLGWSLKKPADNYFAFFPPATSNEPWDDLRGWSRPGKRKGTTIFT